MNFIKNLNYCFKFIFDELKGLKNGLNRVSSDIKAHISVTDNRTKIFYV